MAHHFPARLAYHSRHLVMSAVLIAGCGESPPTAPVRVSVAQKDGQQIAARLEHQAKERAQTAIALTEVLRTTTERYLDEPSTDSRQALQDAWRSAHLAMVALESFCYITMADDQLFEVDAWPMEPGFLDSLPEYPDSGIVNDFTLTISAEALIGQHGITDQSEVSAGFHPVEYYAFARPLEDFQLPPLDTDGQLHQQVERRRHVLRLITAQLGVSLSRLTHHIEVSLPRLFTLPIEATDANPVILAILAGSRRAVQEGFNQANLIIDRDQGHSRASLYAEIATLRAIYEVDGTLYGVIQSVESEAARNLDLTLNQTLGVLGADDPGETDLARVPIMMSAMGHQFDDLDRLLSDHPL
jgi:hypothetical protein